MREFLLIATLFLGLLSRSRHDGRGRFFERTKCSCLTLSASYGFFLVAVNLTSVEAEVVTDMNDPKR